MYLELKRYKDYLHGHIRQLTRASRKAGYEIVVLIDGQLSQSMTITVSKSGPLVEEGYCRMEIFCSKGGYFVILNRKVNFNEAFNVEEIMSDIASKLKAHGIPLQAEGDGDVHVTRNDNLQMDEKLLTADAEDLLNFFRSRFLIDSPRKILYQAQFSRGFNYRGYARDKKELEFCGSSFFDITTKLRSKSTSLTFHCSGNTLRSMNLFPIRPHLGAFWDAKPAEALDLPEWVVFSASALAKCADACIREIRSGNTFLWNWLEQCDAQTGMSQPSLFVKLDENPSDISTFVADRLVSHVHKPGECMESLGDVLQGRSSYFEKAIFIHDIAAIHFNKNQFQVTSYGTTLYLQNGATPKSSNEPVVVTLNSELFNMQPQFTCSRLNTVRLGLENCRQIQVPEYGIRKRVLDTGVIG